MARCARPKLEFAPAQLLLCSTHARGMNAFICLYRSTVANTKLGST